ncbi:MAG: hypothetical protein JXB26_13675 [Candidatus Aminicenantes bacterium]|nr:hypothetical protein [Candidatus Aminicenantes bacterium]
MTKRYITMAILVFCLAAAVSCVGVGDIVFEEKTVALGSADEVEVELRMNSGELKLEGGSDDLMDAEFSYNVERWKPTVDYKILGRRGILKVRQGKSDRIPVGNSHNKWLIRLKEQVSIMLTIDFGAGEGDLDLRGINLASLDIDMGVGDLSLDLSGIDPKDLSVTLDGGVGSAVVYLPRSMNVTVRVDGGLGSVDAPGFQKSGNVYSYETLGENVPRLDVNVDAGIGSIDLKLK